MGLQDPVVELLDAAYRGVVAALPASNVLPGWRSGSTDGLRSNYWCEGSFAMVTDMVINGVTPDTIPDRMILLNKGYFPLSDLHFTGWAQLSSDPADLNYSHDLAESAFEIAFDTIRLD